MFCKLSKFTQHQNDRFVEINPHRINDLFFLLFTPLLIALCLVILNRNLFYITIHFHHYHCKIPSLNSYLLSKLRLSPFKVGEVCIQPSSPSGRHLSQFLQHKVTRNFETRHQDEMLMILLQATKGHKIRDTAKSLLLVSVFTS